MSCVICVDSSLVGAGIYAVCKVNLKSGGEIAYVSSYVALFFTDGEVEVLSGILGHVLSTDLNALNGYCHSNVVLKICACRELLGNIKRLNGLDGLVNDSERTALELLHAGVRFNNGGNRHGHTNLNACCNRVICK